MIDVHDHVSHILGLGKVNTPDISAALGVTLHKERENSHWLFFRSDRSGPFQEVELNLARAQTSWILSVRYNPSQAPTEAELDLARYGKVIDIRRNHKIPPEGVRTIEYAQGGARVSFHFTGVTKRLIGFSIERKALPGRREGLPPRVSP